MGNILFGNYPDEGGNKPQANLPQQSGGSLAVKVLYWLVVLVVLGCSAGFYWLYERGEEAKNLQAGVNGVVTRRLDEEKELYKEQNNKIENRIEVLAGGLKLTKQEVARRAAVIQKQQEEEAARLKGELAKKASAEELGKAQAAANAKIGDLSGDIAGTKKDLDATKQALLGTRGELSGAIARTHDELVALAHRGDRDYFDLILPHKHARQKIGGVAVELLKIDTKKNLFSVNLYFDDKITLRKDKAAFEPVNFYINGAAGALELVVNKVGKDSAGGYLSTPKGLFPNVPNVLAARPEK